MISKIKNKKNKNMVNQNKDLTVRFLILLVFIFAVVATVSLTIVFVGKGKNSASVVSSNGGVNKEEVESIVKDYLTKNPEVIVQSFMVARQKEQEIAEKESSKNVKNYLKEINNDPNSPVLGNAKGKDVVVEYSDYRCGYCKKAAPDIKKLIETNKNVKVIIKNYPILGEESTQIAKLSLAVYKTNPAKFQQFHEGIYQKGVSSKEQGLQLAEEIGIDAKKLAEEVTKSQYQDIINKNLEIGQKIGINGTPAFIVNGNLVRGAVGYDSLVSQLK